MKKLLIIIILILITFLLQSKEKWTLEVLDTIPYSNISVDFLGTNYENWRLINNNQINYYAYDKQCFFNMENLSFYSFGERGKGPGEFIDASPIIEIKNKRYCIDRSKMCLIIFNKKNEFFKEIKLDYQPLTIFTVSDTLIGIPQSLTTENKKGEEYINIYSKDGKFLQTSVKKIEQLYNYTSEFEINYFYSYALYHNNNDNLYIILYGVPFIEKYNWKTNEYNLFNYAKELSFKPAKPYMEYLNNGGFASEAMYSLDIVQEKDNYVIFKAINRKKQNDKGKGYIIKVIFPDVRIDMVEITNKDFNIDWSTLVVYDKKLYKFDDENDVLLIYQINLEN